MLSFAKMKQWLLVYAIIKANSLGIDKLDKPLSWNQFEGKVNTEDILQQKLDIVRRMDSTLGDSIFVEANALNGKGNEELKKK